MFGVFCFCLSCERRNVFSPVSSYLFSKLRLPRMEWCQNYGQYFVSSILTFQGNSRIYIQPNIRSSYVTERVSHNMELGRTWKECITFLYVLFFSTHIQYYIDLCLVPWNNSFMMNESVEYAETKHDVLIVYPQFWFYGHLVRKYNKK